MIVSQLHRSPGVFFDENIHPNGKRLFSARIIPYKGAWLEFSLDINDIMYVHIDRRRKMPVSLLLRALGFSKDGEVLALFRGEEEEQISDDIIGRHLGREDVVNKRTGEIILEGYEEITEENLEALKDSPFSKRIPGILEEAHAMLLAKEEQRLSQSD